VIALLLALGCSDSTAIDGGYDAAIDAPSLRDAGSRPDGGSDAGSASIDGGIEPAPLEEGELSPGGETTTGEIGPRAFRQPAKNLALARRSQFENGRAFFEADWVASPSGLVDRDGLGPLYNALSCIGCHLENGRAPPPASADDPAPGLLFRLGSEETGAPDPVYGGQLQPLAVAGVPPEGRIARTTARVLHSLARGGEVELVAPSYAAVALGYGPLSDVRISPRIANALVGQGLLEAIADDDLASWADPDDSDGDGISGRLHLVAGSIGRFGWKATEPSVRAQTAAAFLGDLGITTPLHPDENCSAAQTACAAAPNGGAPEVSGARLDATAAYVRLLGVPTRREGDAIEVRFGKALFAAFGCANCHRPSYVTGPSEEPELEGQRIWPYTDLLLHDLGPRLSDGRADGGASPDEWRTAPLWGLGLVRTVNGHLFLLHDGRAREVEEAIYWHGGEADAARIAFERASTAERAALVRFVESL
jgi:CxxC motif-containing protein (DUF1111 family)